MKRLTVVALLSLATSSAFAQLAGGPAVRLIPKPAPPSILVQIAPDTTTTGTVEQVLYSYEVEANKLPTDGASRLRVRWQLATANTGNLKQASLRIGGLAGAQVCTTSTTTPGSGSVALIECLRSSSSTLDCWCFGQVGAGDVGILANQITGVDFTAPITLAITGTTPSAAGEMTLSLLRVDGP